MTKAFSIHGVEKRYPGFKLGPLDLELKPGTALALIGPNGAGKTTLMDLLAGVLASTAGEMEVLGHNTRTGDPAWKTAIGYASEQQPFFERWTARANLRFLARFFPDWSRDVQQRLVERFDVPLDKPVVTLSQGNRVKLALVAALAHKPRLLLLDEPTAGLDPLVRSDVLDTLQELLEDDDFTILYSTHILSDIGRLADELAFLRNGRLLLRTARDELERDWRRVSFHLSGGTLAGAAAGSLIDHEVQGAQHRAVSRDFERTADQLHALGATRIEAHRLSLEEIAIHVLRDEATAPEATRASRWRPELCTTDGEGESHAPHR